MEDSKIVQFVQYIARGWALVPLHDVTAGHCSCGAGPSCKSAGKHPRVPEWQRPENLVITPDQLSVALVRWPGANFGLATGLISGVWALDLDPGHVTDWPAVNALTASLPPTWSQRTGSGGRHWLFSLPGDFVPNNSSRRLPAGLDVRGARAGGVSGGQIVLAPSVSGTGPYEVLQAGAVFDAPAVLLDLVRPAPPRVRTGVVGVTGAPSLDAAGRYVVAGINGSLAELRSVASGRNGRAFAAGCRVLELANTGLVDHDAVHAAWWAAAAAHPDPAVTVPDRELLSVWSSVERTVGDRPADLSHVGGPSGWGVIGGEGIRPFAVPGAAPSPGQAGFGSGVTSVTGSVTAQVTGVTSDVTDPVEAMLAQLLSVDQLKTMPPPQPLINGLLDLDTTAWLIGASGSYKSFVALDLAAHVGRGDDWRGRGVHRGEVIYVVAEGARGMKLRVEAWEREYGPMKDVAFLPMPVQAKSDGWSVLVEVCRRRRPVLVVIDTQARVTIGLDENSNSDMSYYAEAVDRIKRATAACVLTVHHLGRSGTNARGASAIDGAQDAELRIEKKGAYVIELHMDKQKDQAEEGPVNVRLRRSEGGADSETGRDLSSLVLDHAADGLGEATGPVEPARITRARALYMLIRDEFNHGEGRTRDEIRSAFLGHVVLSGLAAQGSARRTAAGRALDDLIALGLIIKRDGMQRFKVLVLDDQSVDGVLTPNDGPQARDAPDGWSLWWPDQQQADKHSKTMLNQASLANSGAQGASQRSVR